MFVRSSPLALALRQHDQLIVDLEEKNDEYI